MEFEEFKTITRAELNHVWIKGGMGAINKLGNCRICKTPRDTPLAPCQYCGESILDSLERIIEKLGENTK